MERDVVATEVKPELISPEEGEGAEEEELAESADNAQQAIAGK